MGKNNQYTVRYRVNQDDEDNQAKKIILAVYQALKEKGYNPLNQMVGYLLSGDPAYITSHLNARSLIRQVERDELLEELVRAYLQQADQPTE
ncbi:MAG TPA: IreB family regulatory phosphoprotein [Firmicutes bacterium]|nr:IreB family regulatory phosphoprotein [Bacillota bacterium]